MKARVISLFKGNLHHQQGIVLIELFLLLELEVFNLLIICMEDV
jgi:hypothetical protein